MLRPTAYAVSMIWPTVPYKCSGWC